VAQIIKYQGNSYEITNWDEFSEKLLTAVGFQLEKDIRAEIDKMGLVDTGELRTGLSSSVSNGELIITNSAPHALHIEYGTFDYWGRFGLDKFPKKPLPKKKNLKKKQREGMPKGMQPFAPIRRVLFNQKKMDEVIKNSLKRI